VVGVALGVALIVSVGLINNSILGSYDTLIEALAGRAQLEVRSLNPQGLDEEWLERIRRNGGVQAAAPLLERRSFLFAGERKVPLLLRGIDPEVDSAIRPLSLRSGRALEPLDESAILLAVPLARSLAVDAGDLVELLTPDGFVSYRVVGTFAGLDPLNAPQSRVAVLPLVALQRDFLQGERRVSQVDVVVADDYAVGRIQSGLAALVNGVGFVQEPREQAEQVTELTRNIRFMLLLASAMSLLAAAYLIANNVLATVSERRLDLATLRVLGVSRGRVRRWLLAEVLLLSGLGSVVGVGAGVAASSALARAVSGRLLAPAFPEVGPTTLSPSVLLFGLLIGISLALVAAFPSVYRIARGPVADGLAAQRVTATDLQREARRYRRSLFVALIGCGVIGFALQLSYVPTRAWSVLSLLLVLAVLLAAAAFLPSLISGLGAGLRTWGGSPLWLRLAADSLRQHRRRTGAVAASLMITLAILVGVFGMATSYRESVADWVDGMIGWDLMVSSSLDGLRSAVPLDEGVGSELEQLTGIDLASPERVVTVGYGSSAVSLYAFEMAEFRRMRSFTTLSGLDGEALPAALAGQRRVAISAGLAPMLGLAVGDTLRLDTARGTVPFEVVAVVEDPGAASSAVYLDRSVYVSDWSDTSVDSFALLLSEGADADAVSARLQAHFRERYPLQVVSALTFKRDINAMVIETFGLSQGMVLISVLVALFGLMNAGMIAVWQLRHQLAVMRALGAPGTLLSRTLLAEAWLTGALGGLFGLVLGTLLSTVLLRSVQATSSLTVAWSWPFGSYLVVAGVALLGSLIAASLPARAAERTSLAEALRYR
jgi:putative ABC transport system permease protein